LATNGQINHLNYHQRRLEKSFQALFGGLNPHQLIKHLHPPLKGIHRIRVVYDKDQLDVTYHFYQVIHQNNFVLAQADFDYPFKYEDRSCFDQLKQKYPNEEIIFIKNGLITDTTIANIACFIDGIWLTPTTPLLEGTTRARLLDEKKIELADITLERFKKAEKFALMNALTDFYEVKNATIRDLRD